MKKILLIAGLIISANCYSQNSGDFVIVVNNIKDSDGIIQLALFNNAESFLEDAYLTKSVKVNNTGSATITFKDLPFGTYALSIFNDLNDNEELDTNAIGIPKEPFGFSNNAMGAFGPPSFKKASIRFSENNQSTEIKLKSF